MNRYLVFGLIVLSILVICGCEQRASPKSAGTQAPSSHTQLVPTATKIPQVGTPSGFAADDAWKSKLFRWLRLVYREDNQYASFGPGRSQKLTQPSLYATYGSVGIYDTLEEHLEDESKIGDWIESLAQENGTFVDSNSSITSPRLATTLWAVETLARLRRHPRSSDKTIAFLISLRNSDGLFHDETFSKDSLDDDIVATYWSVHILHNLDQNLATAPYLEKTKQTLVKYLQSQLGMSAREIVVSPSGGTFLVGAHALALIDPAAVPSNVRQRLVETAQELSLSNNFAVLARTYDLLTAVELCGLELSQNTRARLRDDYLRQVLPAIAPASPFSNIQRDPMGSFLMVQVGQRLGIKLPAQPKLFAQLEIHRIENGWSRFSSLQTTPGSTYQALLIAKRFGFQDYDSLKVRNYLEQFIEPNSAAQDIRSARSAMRALRLVDALPDKTTLKNLDEIIAQTMIRVPDKQFESQLLELTLLYREMGWQWPKELDKRVEKILARPDVKNAQLSDGLHSLAMIQSVTGVETVPRDQLASRLLQLQSSDGGFKAYAQSAYADVKSTALVIDALTALGYGEKVNIQKLHEFVLTCQDEYGFNYMSPKTIKQLPDSSSVYSSLDSTYQAIALLDK